MKVRMKELVSSQFWYSFIPNVFRVFAIEYILGLLPLITVSVTLHFMCITE